MADLSTNAFQAFHVGVGHELPQGRGGSGQGGVSPIARESTVVVALFWGGVR